jgi:hypothetical protein
MFLGHSGFLCFQPYITGLTMKRCRRAPPLFVRSGRARRLIGVLRPPYFCGTRKRRALSTEEDYMEIRIEYCAA